MTKKLGDTAATETALRPLEAVAARVIDGGCRPEAWTLRLLASRGLELAVAVFPIVVAARLVQELESFLFTGVVYLVVVWWSVVVSTHMALDDLVGDRAGAPGARLRQLGDTFCRAIPLGVAQVAVYGLLFGLVVLSVARPYWTPLGWVLFVALPLWFHSASVFSLVRRRLRGSESWARSWLAGHGQVLRLFPLALVDIGREWRRRNRLRLGWYPGVPGQGTVHSRLGMAWALGLAGPALGFGVAVVLTSLLPGGYDSKAVAFDVFIAFSTAAGAVAAINLTHAYASHLTLASGHLDAWLAAGATPQALPSGTGAPPPGPPDGPSQAAGSGAG